MKYIVTCSFPITLLRAGFCRGPLLEKTTIAQNMFQNKQFHTSSALSTISINHQFLPVWRHSRGNTCKQQLNKLHVMHKAWNPSKPWLSACLATWNKTIWFVWIFIHLPENTNICNERRDFKSWNYFFIFIFPSPYRNCTVKLNLTPLLSLD